LAPNKTGKHDISGTLVHLPTDLVGVAGRFTLNDNYDLFKAALRNAVVSVAIAHLFLRAGVALEWPSFLTAVPGSEARITPKAKAMRRRKKPRP
jgi:hypothetical protein